MTKKIINTVQDYLTVVGESRVYQIVNVDSGLCLDVEGGATTADANVVVSDCVNQARQQWRPVGTPSGAYMWVNLNSSQLLEVSGGSNAIQGTYANADRQLWSVSPI